MAQPDPRTADDPAAARPLSDTLAPAAARATACLFTGSREDRVERAFRVLGSACGCRALRLLEVAPDATTLGTLRDWQSNGDVAGELGPLSTEDRDALAAGQPVRHQSAHDNGGVILVPVPHERGLRFVLAAAFDERGAVADQPFIDVLAVFAENLGTVLDLPVELAHVRQRIRIDDALVQISHMLVASREIDFETLLRLVGQATGVEAAYFVRLPFDAESLTDASHRDDDSTTVFRWQASGEFTVERMLDALSAGDGAVATPPAMEEESVTADASAVPVLSLGDRLFGYLGFEYGQSPTRWRDEDSRVLGILGDILATFFERKLAERALQESEERWRRLVEHHPEPILLTARGVIYYVNRAAVRVLGAADREQLIGSSLQDFVSAEYFDALETWNQQIDSGLMPEPKEHEMIRFDGEERIVESASVPITYEGRSFALTVMRDVTAQRLAEEGYRTFVETITEAICRVDLDRPIGRDALPILQRKHILEYGFVAECNDIMAELLGKRRQDVEGQAFASALSHVRPSVVDEFIENGYRLRNREVTAYRQGRQPRHFLINAVGTLERGKLTRIWGSCIEVTERVELERRIVGALEEQQQEIGRDLHDGVGQLLTGVRMLTQNLVERFREEDHPAFDVAEKVARFAEEATRHVRDIYRGLTPAQLYHEGLSATLAELAHTIDSLPDIHCQFVHTGGVEIDNRDVKLHLFRIAQEAVNNALKHAKAHNIAILFGREDEQIVLRVKDDGVGLHTPSDNRGTSIGLDSMRYRAGAIGGTLAVETNDAGGTLIECRIPVRR